MKKSAQKKHITELTAIAAVFTATLLLLFSVGIIMSPPQNSYSVYAASNNGYLQLSVWMHFAILLLVPALFALFCILLSKGYPNKDIRGRDEVVPFVAFLLLAVAIRILLAVSTTGYVNDINAFKAWGYRMLHTGPRHYYSPDYFCDYPPGYLYLLAVPQWITEVFSIDLMSQTATLVYKMPAVICEIVLGMLVYRNAAKEFGHRNALFLSVLVLFNPAFILDSSVWGQIESIMILLIVLSYLLAEGDKVFLASIIYCMAVLIKPQALMMGPAFLLYAVVWMVRNKRRGVLTGFAAILSGLAAFLAVSLPFWIDGGIGVLFEKYFGTMTSYPYITLNAMNVYQLFGLNAQVVNKVAGGLMLGTWGTIGIVASLAVGVTVFFLKKDNHPLLYCAVAMQYALYLFGPYMHERYLLLTVALLILLMMKTHDVRYLYIVLITSTVQFVSMMTVLRVMHFQSGDMLVTAGSALNIAGFLLFLCFAFTERSIRLSPQIQAEKIVSSKENRQKRILDRLTGEQKRERLRWSAADYIIVFVITVSYALVAFFRLGDMKWPQTYWQPEEWGSTYDVDFGEIRSISSVQLLEGIGQGSFEVFYSENGKQWIDSGVSVETNYADFLSWIRTDLALEARYLRISVKEVGFRVYEMAFLDEADEPVDVRSVNDSGTNDVQPFTNVFDEPDTVPNRPSYMNGTYFDEVYHARTAYEQIKGWPIYEQTHPPLGKDLIALGIRVFGMSPFGWRFMGVLSGVMMLPALYVFGKLLFNRKRWAVLLTAMMGLDFMHFVQTRIATIDSFAVLFIILTYLFMFIFWKQDYYGREHWKRLLPLLFSGIFFGAASAVKWIGFYAGAGLAVLLFLKVLLCFAEYSAAGKALKNSDGLTSEEESVYLRVRKNYVKNTVVLLLCCLVLFVAIPAAIYCASYIPYLRAEGQPDSLFEIILRNQEYIFNYHSKYVLDMQQSHPHPYQSKWYTWPMMSRPLFYYMGEYLPQGMTEGISAFGNPAIWWTGIIAFVWVCFTVFSRTSKETGLLETHEQKWIRVFILVSLLAQFVPWIFVKRSTYIYHYFATTPFLMMSIVFFFEDLIEHKSRKRQIVWISAYLLVCAVMFVLFYPLLAGTTIPASYAKHFRWFPSWVLYAYWQ